MAERRRIVVAEGPEAVLQQAPARPDAVLQRRGMARVKAILDAAEELMVADGYGAATLKAIGERAGIPTASVYHYFADRYQVDAALIARHIAAFREQVAAIESRHDLNSIADVASAVVDPMVKYFRKHPSAVQLWFVGRDDALAEPVGEFDAWTAETVWRLMLTRGLLAEGTPLLVMQLAFEAGGRLFDVAFAADPKGDSRVIREAKRLLTAYLETYAH